jgi:hypothetical protein
MKVLNTLFVTVITLFCLISSSTQFANLKKVEIETSSFLQTNKIKKSNVSNSASEKASEKTSTCSATGCVPEPKGLYKNNQ